MTYGPPMSAITARAANVAARGTMVLAHKGTLSGQTAFSTFTATVERMRRVTKPQVAYPW